MTTPEADFTDAPETWVRVTCTVHHRLLPEVLETVRTLRVRDLTIEAARAAVLVMRNRHFPLFSGTRLDSYPVDSLRFLVTPDSAEAVVTAVTAAGRFEEPGRGTVYAETVQLHGLRRDGRLAPAAEDAGVAPAGPSPASPARLRRRLAAIACILSRPNAGNTLARLALELGICVPVVSVGAGTGLRDRLGLLRVTIPREKEFVHLLAPEHDAESILGMLVEAGQLNQPGKGFVYTRPVDMAVLNTRLRVGRQRTAASVEQMISAIDDLTGGTAWRRRYPELELFQPADHRTLSRELFELVLTSDVEYTEEFVRAAVAAGAPGATRAEVGRIDVGDEAMAAACERTVIVVPSARRSPVVRALLEVAARSPAAADTLEIAPVLAAYSYVPRASVAHAGPQQRGQMAPPSNRGQVL